jgi:hypothetical protein
VASGKEQCVAVDSNQAGIGQCTRKRGKTLKVGPVKGLVDVVDVLFETKRKDNMNEMLLKL